MTTTTDIKNLGHSRASFAYQRVNEVKDGPFEGEYRSASLNASAMIHNAGLMQTLAFYCSKFQSGEGKKHFGMLASHVMQWLLNENKLDPVYDPNKKPILLFTQILNANDEMILLYTRESQEFVEWLKRFSEGMLKKSGGD